MSKPRIPASINGRGTRNHVRSGLSAGENFSSLLEQAVQVDDGLAYLKKIVQVGFRVPRPEAFDLRHWFQDEVRALFANELSQMVDLQRPASQRLAQTIDNEGGHYLTTPRDVILAINALRLHAIPVRSNIDIADMVWLQVIRLGNPSLYSWIEEYLTEISAIHRGATISNHLAEQMGERLEQIFTDEGVDAERARFDLAQVLPGISLRFSAGQNRDARRVFNNLDRAAFDRFIAERRLGSPEHYRYYFAFSLPAGALRDDQVRTFIDQAERQPDEAVRMFGELAGQSRPQGGVMAEVLIERLIAEINRIPEPAIPGILASFAAGLDDVALSSRNGDFHEHRAWGAAKNAIGLLLKRIVRPEQRARCLTLLFTEGNSLGWLTSLLRSEIFAHGHFGDQIEPEDRRMLTPAEFGEVLATMLQRFAEMPADALVRVPNLVSLLYGWQQGSRGDDARRWVQANTRNDNDLLTFLSRARGWSSTDLGVQYPLQRRDLANFLDYEDALQRVRRIASDDNAPAEQRQLARDLLVAFQQGQRHL